MSIRNLFYAAAVLSLLWGSAAAQTGQRTWQYYLKRGQLQFKAEMYDFAILSLDKALEQNPSLFQAANILSDIYAIKGKKLQSLSYLESSLKIESSQPDVHNKIGELYEFYGYSDKAFGHYKTAAALDPAHVMGNINLVRHYIRLKQNETAQKHFTAGHLNGKKDSDPMMAQAAEAEQVGDTNGAIELYALALKKNPAELEAYGRLFELCRSIKDFRKAADTLERLTFIKPDYEPAYIKLGHLYFADPLSGKKDRNLKKSIHYFLEAIRLNPDNTDTYLILSQVYRYMGKADEADMVEKKISELGK